MCRYKNRLFIILNHHIKTWGCFVNVWSQWTTGVKNIQFFPLFFFVWRQCCQFYGDSYVAMPVFAVWTPWKIEYNWSRISQTKHIVNRLPDHFNALLIQAIFFRVFSLTMGMKVSKQFIPRRNLINHRIDGASNSRGIVFNECIKDNFVVILLKTTCQIW